MNKHVVTRFLSLFGIGLLISGALSATTVIPISDRALLDRANVVVRGIVVSSRVSEDPAGRPETISEIEPIDVLKGELKGTLVLHQLGGDLPDGRFLKIWGRPEYEAGHEVLVFALARPEGDYQTAELMLGKFDIQQDEEGTSFAAPAFSVKTTGVTVLRARSRSISESDIDGEDDIDRENVASNSAAPRELSGFLRFLRQPDGEDFIGSILPSGQLRTVLHSEYVSRSPRPLWGNIGGLWRWSNGATAVWTLDGSANVTGGGTAEAGAATMTWNDEPNSTINYSIGTGGANPIHLNAPSSPCGWSTCIPSSGGVIGCGGPGGGGSNSWRGENYTTITYGEVWLRSYCSLNGFDSITTQSVLTHELGHTLGLGHSDQSVSPHDVCRGDEDLATMRSSVQHRTSLGTDDSDAVRWIYGDGGSSCGGSTLSITSLSPAKGAVGASVAINGTGFTGVTAVAFNGTPASFTLNTDVKITATVPTGATTGKISVTTPTDTAMSAASFIVAPRITSFAPQSGAPGTSVVITGVNFTAASSVRFNGASASFAVDSSTQITASVPASATTGPITVATSAGTATSAASFTVAPRITSFTPASGPAGASVTINGANFTGATAVTFNGTPATYIVNTAAKITATVPSGATAGTISVTTPAGTATGAASFTVILTPAISNFTPTSGAVGASVTINGTHFTGTTSIKLNGTAASFTVNSDIKITATVPANATTGKITATNAAGTATSASDFTVAPRITTLTPTSGLVGSSVSINGANLTGAGSVKFNGVAADDFMVNSSINITATVPPGATTGRISVTTPAGTATSSGNYSVKPNITGFTPPNGAVGIGVTLTGTGFLGATSVKLNGLTSSFHADSGTQITATVPANATTGTISVTTAGGTATSTTSFTVAPRITSFTPASGVVGVTVTIYGANFTGATSVTFNGVASAYTVSSATKITATVPVGATTGNISVTTSAGAVASAGTFTAM